MSAVGFIGLGLMGEGFTRRLIETRHRVIGFDIDPEKTRAAAMRFVASSSLVE